MTCPRCRGLMCPIDLGIEASTSGRDGTYAWRCISCGEIIDPVIVWNRMRTKTQRLIREQPKPARRLFRSFPSSLSSRDARSVG